MFGRTDVSRVGHWWWTVDRWSLGAFALLIGMGAILVMAASPAVASRLGLDPHHFIDRQLAVALPALALIIGVSLMPPRGVRRLAALGFTVSLVFLLWTVVDGVEVKGARRWLDLGGMVFQPSELIKPTLAVTTAAVLAAASSMGALCAQAIAAALLLLVVGVLLMQPDFGMAAVVSGVWFVQVFMAGLSFCWVLALALCGGVIVIAAYDQLPHVQSRIDRFIDPASGDSYQVDTALEALRVGGLLGRGPGEGQVKSTLPDAHADFIFAVAGEEFGALVGLGIIGLFAFIVLRGLSRLTHASDLFTLLAAAGLLTQFGFQAVINIGVNLHLLPTKGMTLPFISYGGSSMLALAAAMGMLLALTRSGSGHRMEGRSAARPVRMGAS